MNDWLVEWLIGWLLDLTGLADLSELTDLKSGTDKLTIWQTDWVTDMARPREAISLSELHYSLAKVRATFLQSIFVFFPFQAQPNLQLNSARLVKPVILFMKDQWNIIDAEMNKTNFITLISPAD